MRGTLKLSTRRGLNKAKEAFKVAAAEEDSTATLCRLSRNET